MSGGPTVLFSYPLVLGRPGVGLLAACQARELSVAGAAVTVVAAGIEGDATLPPEVATVTSLTVGGRRIPHRALGSVDRAMAWHDLVTSRVLARLVGRGHLDVLHGWPGAGRRSFAAARRHGVPSVREVPNTHTEHAYAVMQAEMDRLGLPTTAGHSHAPNPARLRAEEQEYATATALLCPADSVAVTFLDRGFAPERLLRTRYGYDPEAGYHPGPPGAAGQPLRLLFVGRCEPRKGLHFALDAWIASGVAERGATFEIYGSFYPGYAELLGRRLEAPGVAVRGFTDDVPAVMAGADALTLPSLEEGSALVTYEAQAAGCALLVSDEAGAVCTSGEQGLVHPAGDVPALAEHIATLARDRPLLERLRGAAVRQAAHLRWADAARILIDRYAEAATLATRPAPQ